MSIISENIKFYYNEVRHSNATLIAISKTKPDEDLMEAYQAGQRDFGENKVQEMCGKYERLPKDIRWHMVGHLQTNKIKYIVPFVYLIHGVDSVKLLKEINKESKKLNVITRVLLQIHIAKEETKFGFDSTDLFDMLKSDQLASMENIKLCGLMGMATFTEDQNLIIDEFKSLKNLFQKLKSNYPELGNDFCEMSMGMSNDYKLALQQGATMIRIGSSIFGERNYGA